jgi:ABC-2 type transport system permease protein
MVAFLDNPYVAMVRLSFLKFLAYRLRYFTGIVTYLLFVSVHYFIWQAVFKGSGVSVLNGFTFSEMVTYIAIGWISRSLYFSDIDEEISEHVRTGQISSFLVKPIKFHLMMLSEAIGGLIFRFFFFTLPIAVVLLSVYPISLPYSFLNAVAFIMATAGSFFVLAEINFLLGLLCFRLKSIDGIIRAKYFFIQLFSGLLLPLSFYPGWLRAIFEYLPFKLIAFTPLEIYLGKIHGIALLYSIAYLFCWGFLLFISAEILWKRSFNFLSIQGG